MPGGCFGFFQLYPGLFFLHLQARHSAGLNYVFFVAGTLEHSNSNGRTSHELYTSLKAAPNFQRDSLFIFYDPGIQHTVILPPCLLGQRPKDHLIHTAQQGCCSWKLKGGTNDCVVFERFDPLHPPTPMASKSRRYSLKQQIRLQKYPPLSIQNNVFCKDLAYYFNILSHNTFI